MFERVCVCMPVCFLFLALALSPQVGEATRKAAGSNRAMTFMTKKRTAGSMGESTDD